MKKRVLAVMLTAMMAVSMVACGSTAAPAADSAAPAAEPAEEPTEDTAEEPAEEPAASGDLIKVGIVNLDPSESGYRSANVRSYEETFCEANGYDAQFAYFMKNEEQIQAAQKFIQDGVDYLLISAADAAGWDSTLQDAADAGVQVILFDRMLDCDESLFVAAVVSDMLQEGITATNWLLEQGSDLKVVHIQGPIGSDPQIGRGQPLDEAADAGKLTIVEAQAADWQEEKAQQIVQSVIDSGKEFNVIYADNDGMAKGAVAALDNAGISHGRDGDVIVMGFDCNTYALQNLLDGTWNYDGQCNPFQAPTIDEVINTLESGGTISEKKIITEEKGFDTNTITQEDIDTYGI